MKFKNFFLLLFCLSAVQIFSQSTYFIKYKDNVDINVVNNIVFTKSIFSKSQTDKSLNSNFDVKHFFKINDVRISRIIKIEFDKEVSEYNFTSMVGNNPDIEYYEKSVLLKVDDVPNDSLVNEQWGLRKIQAFDAWNLTKGKEGILIGIIDTGIDYLHPDLKNKISLNNGEVGIDINGKDKRNNNIDDDNNGFIDDFMGWDFTDRVGFPFDSAGGDYLGWDNNPNDDYGHGTYIAGICAGESNNKIGISGVAPNIKIINARAFDPEGYGEEDDAAAAILYAVQMGAKVINMSFGDNAFSYVLKDVIQYAHSQNVVLVASSGNSGSNLPHYPSGYSEVISVGNSTVEDYVSSNSNYGSTLDLVAPGSLITTTSMDSGYSTVSGTSASAPFVSAAAALILSLQDFTNDEVVQILKTTSDDILETGWDERSGAGRLNLLKALSINAPSKVTFNYPHQDFATLQDTISINTTILSAYFIRYELLYGVGLNPDSWTKLTEGQNQIVNQNIFTLNSKNLADTSYTFRIVVYLNNGRTLEERINFYVDRTAPKAELVNLIPAFYGDKPTIMASIYTDEPSVVKMYFRTGNSEFNYITLDGFASNNKSVKQLHYGFIPKQLVQNNDMYEVYFEAENLVGLKTIIKDGNNNFSVQPSYNAQYASKTELPFSLPVGTLFNKPVNFTSPNKNEILFSTFYPSPDLIYGLFKLENNSFVKLDSIKNQRPRDFGDFNSNGKKDLLSSIQRNGFIYEQSEANGTALINKYSDSTGNFWPILVDDIDNDNVQEVLSIAKDSLLIIHKINANLQLESPDTLKNFTTSGYYSNAYDAPFCLVVDTDNDGLKEIWIADGDGDIMS
ncbi:MAG: S8 family peptidase, partial [Syntrophothermus sp.]